MFYPRFLKKFVQIVAQPNENIIIPKSIGAALSSSALLAGAK